MPIHSLSIVQDCALAGILGMLFLAGMILSATAVHKLKDKTSADSFSAAAVSLFAALLLSLLLLLLLL